MEQRFLLAWFLTDKVVDNIAQQDSEFSSPYRDMPLAVHTSFADLPCSPARGNATGRTSILSCYHPTGTEINPSPVSSDDLRHPPLVACAPATSSHGWHHHHRIMAHRLMFTCPSAASPANCRRRHPPALIPSVGGHLLHTEGRPFGSSVLSSVREVKNECTCLVQRSVSPVDSPRLSHGTMFRVGPGLPVPGPQARNHAL